MIKHVDYYGLTDLAKEEGYADYLVFQGCGGDLGEWVEGVNSMLVEEGVLNQPFSDEVICFEAPDGLINLGFPLKGLDFNSVSKLAVWRIANHDIFGGTWLSDYIDNYVLNFTEE